MNGTMIVDPCMMFGQDEVRRIVGMALAGAMVEPVDVSVGQLTFGSMRLDNIFCPNLRIELTAPFTVSGLFSLSGTLRLSARVTLRITPVSGGRAASVCLTEIRALGISIPASPGLESTALGLAGQFLPGELCFDVTGLLG